MLTTIITLRHPLHSRPEFSGQETCTRAILMNFLAAHTTLDIHLCGNGFYTAHREASPTKPAIALRADYDALAMPNGTATHLCGHDGHSAWPCMRRAIVLTAISFSCSSQPERPGTGLRDVWTYSARN